MLTTKIKVSFKLDFNEGGCKIAMIMIWQLVTWLFPAPSVVQQIVDLPRF
jgi:hypothetical protein